jgi:para-aminobenzoate synthetase/4-amino-4-deoxychorismate lyase
VELSRVRLEAAGSPAQVLRALRGDRRPFLLVGTWAGGGAIAGAEPLRDVPEQGFEALDRPPVAGPHGAVGGGWVGVLGFGLGATVERLPPPPPRPVPGPLASGALYDHVLRMTPDGEWWFEALVTDARRAALDARLGELRERLRTPAPARPWRLTGMDPAPPGHDGHRWAVADAVRRIAEGELFQANLCLRLDGRLDGDPLDVFADVAPALRPALGAFVAGEDGAAVLSFSPELFLRREGRTASTGPIKGTAPRPAGDPEAATAARAALAASGKDAAEHVMIVDPCATTSGGSRATARSRPTPRPWWSRTPACGTSSPRSGRSCATTPRTPACCGRRSRPAR